MAARLNLPIFMLIAAVTREYQSAGKGAFLVKLMIMHFSRPALPSIGAALG